MALTDKLKAIADAIRAKTGKSDSMTLAEMPTEIENISTGGGINPEWTDWGYFSAGDNRNDLVSKLKYNDTSNGISFGAMFRYCTLLTEIPDFDTSNGTSFTEMFYYCSSLITAPNIDTSKGTNFNSMFYSCANLINIPRVNLSLATSMSRIFYNSKKLENITFEDIIPITQNIDLLSTNVSLTTDSLMSFINALQNTTGTTYKVTIGSTNLAKLTADQIQIATDKNITLA